MKQIQKVKKGYYYRSPELRKAQSERQKGKPVPWACMPVWNKGKKLSEEHKKAISTAKLGSKNAMWKGSIVGYSTLHAWVRRHLGTPSKCEHCLESGNNRQWANKSRLYKRELTDWIRLCTSCHGKYDTGHKRRKPSVEKAIVKRKKGVL